MLHAPARAVGLGGSDPLELEAELPQVERLGTHIGNLDLNPLELDGIIRQRESAVEQSHVALAHMGERQTEVHFGSS